MIISFGQKEKTFHIFLNSIFTIQVIHLLVKFNIKIISKYYLELIIVLKLQFRFFSNPSLKKKLIVRIEIKSLVLIAIFFLVMLQMYNTEGQIFMLVKTLCA